MQHALKFFFLVFALSQTAWAASQGKAKYNVIDLQVTSPAPQMLRLKLTVQVGQEPLNRLGVVHLPGKVQKKFTSRAKPPVVLLAPFGFPAEFWEQSDDGSYLSAFAPRIAEAGYDVWLVDSRLAQAAPGECESGAVNCAPMVEWGIDTAREDALFVSQMAKLSSLGRKPVLGGLSGGSATALSVVNERPQLFSGLFLWEGTLISDDPAIQARNAAFCDDDIAMMESGMYYDASVQVFKILFQLAQESPQDPTFIPVFPPGTTNLQALLFALTFPDPQNPLNFTDSFIRFIGNPFEATLAFSDLDRVLGLGTLVGNYAPVAFIRDTHCSIGGAETRFVDNLDAFRGKVLVFAEGYGFGSMMLDTAARFSRADVTVDYQPEFGESDRFFHVNWEGVALEPLLDWLED